MKESLLEAFAGDAGSNKQRADLTFRANLKQRRHGWIRLTPAYSLNVVHTILQNHSKEDLILDPFSGTGTTPLVGASLGIPSHSVDINPFLVWLGNLKLTAYPDSTRDEVLAASNRIIARIKRRKIWAGAWVPPLHQIEKWWDLPVLEVLARINEAISSDEDLEQKGVQDLLRIAFCRTLIQVSHASFNHQSMSFKKVDKDAQEELFAASPEDIVLVRQGVFRTFLDSAATIADSLKLDTPTTKAQVFLGDSRDLAACLPSKKYTTVITSPPYPNRMSYIRELRPYMYWLNYLSDGRAAGELDWQAIGGTWGCATSNLGTWESDPDEAIPYKAFDGIVSQIDENHKLLSRYVHKYFQDIKLHLRSLRTVLAPGAECYYVVGNSKFYDTMLPVEEIYEALFKDSGFVETRIVRLRKRNSKKELYEYVVYAKNP